MAKKTKGPNVNTETDLDQDIELGQTANPATRPHFEEWECKILGGGKYEKLKLRRKCVKISEEQADLLNESRIKGGNAYAHLYFKPE